jgi:putative ABC transport system ATP-binding protein
LADEPTGQLDHAAADVIVTALLETADDLDAALVVTTHDPILAARLDSSWPMADGALLASSDGRTGSGACSA